MLPWDVIDGALSLMTSLWIWGWEPEHYSPIKYANTKNSKNVPRIYVKSVTEWFSVKPTKLFRHDKNEILFL